MCLRSMCLGNLRHGQRKHGQVRLVVGGAGGMQALFQLALRGQRVFDQAVAGGHVAQFDPVLIEEGRHAGLAQFRQVRGGLDDGER